MTKTKDLPIISVRRQGGLFYFWTLTAFGKSFYLGRDMKFCREKLGMEGEELVEQLGSNDLLTPESKQKLAQLIIDKLALTQEKADSLQEHELSVEGY